MTSVRELVDSPDVLLSLQPEELASVVLQDLVTAEKTRNAGRMNRHNYSLEFRNSGDEVQRAIMEAWAWLENTGCLACQPGNDGWFFVTRRGHQLSQTSEPAVFSREQTLPRHLLHPTIEQKAWPPFIRGDFDSAVFEAFKQVEIAIRTASGLDQSLLGVALARKAFQQDDGPLTDKTVVKGEQQALSDLMAGALGSYKNPHSHRNVAITDADEAAEMIVLASHLLKIAFSRSPT